MGGGLVLQKDNLANATSWKRVYGYFLNQMPLLGNIIVVLLFMIYPHNMMADMTKKNIYVPVEIDENFARQFVLTGKADYTDEIKKIVLFDMNFKEALKVLNNKDEQVSGFSSKNNGGNAGVGGQNFKHPDYIKALKLLELSIKKTSNPVSAYIFRMISTNIYATTLPVELKPTLRRSEQILFEYGVCDGFIAYGKTLEGEKKYTEALAVYKVGKDKCGEDSWVGNMLAGRIALIEHMKGGK